ncbi:MAG: hypothetical protein ACXW0U_06975 [Halobacteriota archaeon]
MEKLNYLASSTQADIRRILAMTSDINSTCAAEQLDQRVMQMKKARTTFSVQVSSLKKIVIGIAIPALVLISSPRPAHADTPAAAIALAFAGAAVGGVLAANAVWDAATSDTTTTTDSTTTDDEGNTTDTTTTSTEKSTATPTPPDTPRFLSVSGTAVATVITDKTIAQMIGKTYDNADILLTNKNITSVSYKVRRSIKTMFKRKPAFPKETVKVVLNLNFDELFVSTRDIPKTDGSSKMTVTLSANGKLLYTFKASVDQGKIPSFSDEGATEHVVKKGSDILAINDFKKHVEFDAGPGRESDEIVVTILTEGTGKRI